MKKKLILILIILMMIIIITIIIIVMFYRIYLLYSFLWTAANFDIKKILKIYRLAPIGFGFRT